MEILRRIFVLVKDPNMNQYRIIWTNAEVHDQCQTTDIVKSIKSQRLRSAGQVQRAPDDHKNSIGRKSRKKETARTTETLMEGQPFKRLSYILCRYKTGRKP